MIHIPVAFRGCCFKGVGVVFIVWWELKFLKMLLMFSLDILWYRGKKLVGVVEYASNAPH